MNRELTAPLALAVDDDFATFFAGHYSKLAGALLLYVGDEDVAQECAQEALARACRDWRRVRKMNEPGAWLYRVAFNVANSFYRRRKLERRANDRLVSLPATTTPDETVISALLIRAALKRLPKRRRAALVLRYFAGFSTLEIADALGCSDNAAKKLVNRAMTSLRKDRALHASWEGESDE